MYGGQKNHIVKVELGETIFVQYILVEIRKIALNSLFLTFHLLSPLLN